MKHIVNDRLVWHLETNHQITEFQSVDQKKNQSTIAPLICLETFVREAFINKEHVVAVFFDLKKAYDMTWKHGILSDLHDINRRGNFPIFF